jgi:hypothetical protein
MSDDEFAAVIGAADQQMAQPLARAQASLDLFEKDCGRRATTALDIRVWADVQVPENLRFRILRRVHTAQVWTEACKRIWNDIPAPLASRPPMGQRISLSPAAKTTGLSESTILAAIENGRIVGMKDILDGWPLERAQLCHVFPPAPAGPAKSDSRRALLDGLNSEPRMTFLLRQLSPGRAPVVRLPPPGCAPHDRHITI